MQETSEKIYEAAKDHLLIAAHRGTAGGNIPCNTIQSYEAALLQGADIMEIDVSVSKDRKLFVFHPGMEPAHLRSSRYIKDMTADEVAQLRFVNQDGTPTECPVSTLDEIFDLFKNRCFINVDKFWTAIPEITDCIRRHGVQDQVIVKTSPKEEWFKQIEDYAPELPYMPIIQSNDKITDMLLTRKLNFIGAEVLFDKDDEETASDEYIEKMHKHGLLLWVNAIIYNYKKQLSAGHSDDVSIIGRMDDGWGWLADKKYDIVQTDWMLPIREYYKGRGMKVKDL